jgi:Holliday junction resolvasome RuvABC endonuclease subunit
MVAVGAHITIQNGRFVAGFAVVDEGLRLEDQFSISAPPDEAEAAQFHELFDRTRDLIAHRHPDLFALRVSEITGVSNRAKLAHRAEGVVLAAAGQSRDLVVSYWIRQSLGRVAGLGAIATGHAAVDALARLVTPEPTSNEIRQAAAAAAAAIRDATP